MGRRVKTGFIRVALNGRYYKWVSWMPNISGDTLTWHYGSDLSGDWSNLVDRADFHTYTTPPPQKQATHSTLPDNPL